MGLTTTTAALHTTPAPKPQQFQWATSPNLGSPEDNCIALWKAILEAYKELDTNNQYGILKLSMFGPNASGYPVLKGRAAVIKSFTPALMRVWAAKMNPLDEVHQRIHLVLETGMEMDAVLDRHVDEFRLPPAVAERFFKLCLSHAQTISSLANLHGLKLFNVTMKVHYMIHIGHRSGHLNPRLAWCFLNEDFMKHNKTLAMACLKGNSTKQFSRKFASKMSLAMHCTFSEIDLAD